MTDLSADVIRMVKSAPWLVAVLEAVRDVAPPNWYVAAGAVRNTVWDILSGRPSHGPHGDIDIVYWDGGLAPAARFATFRIDDSAVPEGSKIRADACERGEPAKAAGGAVASASRGGQRPPVNDGRNCFDAPGDRHDAYANQLAARLSQHDIELTNQALVHLWQSERLGRDIPPYPSVSAAISAWPETATAVGVTLNDHGDLSVLAPLGLRDLLSLTLRPNPLRVDRDSFRTRLQQKRWPERWPALTVIASPHDDRDDRDDRDD